MELVKENIEYEQLLGENSVEAIVRDEYVIPDTHPDVFDVLVLDAKPKIINKEVMQDKVYLEGQIEYNVLYMAREGEKTEVYNVNYSASFSNTIDCEGTRREMMCDADCHVEHIDCSIVNERKVCIEGIIGLKCEVYNNYDYSIVKDVENPGDIQFWKNPAIIDKIVRNDTKDLVGQCHMQIPVEKPEVGKIIKYDVSLHKKEVKVLESKIKLAVSANVKMLYKANNSRDLFYMENEVEMEDEFELENVRSDMFNYADFQLANVDYAIREDDLGENRIVDFEIMIRANMKIMAKEQIDMIEDAYSPSMILNMDKKEYKMNVIHNQVETEVVAKGDIELDDMPKPKKIVMSTADVCVTDKKVVEDKVIIDGVMNVDVIYSTDDDEKYVHTVKEEIPFTCPIDMPGTKINMQCVGKADLENLEADIEAGNIAVKGLIKVYTRVNYAVNKEFLVDICPGEGEVPKKKASITIYVVQNGDTLWKIAKRYNSTVEDLVNINEIENPDHIKPSQKLIIPGRAVI